MREFAPRFVPLGEIVDVRFGVKTGCDAFFMPWDVTSRLLDQYTDDPSFRAAASGCPRRDAQSGKVKIVEAGDGSIHPIESEYLRPEVHSLMNVDRPVVSARSIDRLVLLVNKPLSDLKGTWVHRYLTYGKTAAFASKKSKPVPIPQRSTCAGRDPWYDLTRLVRPGFAFWPMSQQYRHIIAGNPDRLICNHNLFDLGAGSLTVRQQGVLIAILNSTLIALFKTFYGRFAGTEGNLKTEVVDVNLLEVPDPRGVAKPVAARLIRAYRSLCKREVGRLVEEQLMDCHSPGRAQKLADGPLVLSTELQQPDRRELDDAVFELLGVSDSEARKQLVDELHCQTALHFRAIRKVEIQKMEQRSGSGSRRLNAHDLAADAWDAANLADLVPAAEWLSRQPESTHPVNIPEDRPATLSPSPMFDPNTVYFGKTRRKHLDCESRGQAELLLRVAELGISGIVRLPVQLAPAIRVLDRFNARLKEATARFAELAESRAGSDDKLSQQVTDLLARWFIHGRTPPTPTPD